MSYPVHPEEERRSNKSSAETYRIWSERQKTKRYVIHADYSPEQVISQTAWLNKEGRNLIAFTNRDGSMSVLLPEGAVIRAATDPEFGRGVTAFNTNVEGWSYISAWTDSVEEIEL